MLQILCTRTSDAINMIMTDSTVQLHIPSWNDYQKHKWTCIVMNNTVASNLNYQSASL